LALTGRHREAQETVDDDLITLIRSGNMIAFSTLIDRHRVFITRVVSRFLLWDEDVCEVVQDTFIRVWKHLGEFDERSRFTTWIYAIAFNLCLDRMRLNRRRPTTFDQVDFEYLPENCGRFHIILKMTIPGRGHLTGNTPMLLRGNSAMQMN